MPTQIFENTVLDSVPNHNHLGFLDKKSYNPKKVVEFLGFTQNDVSRATALPRTVIRYDARMPRELEERLLEIGAICELVAGHFKGDIQKTNLWLRLPNTLLGNISPREMIRFGRYRKLYKFVTNALAGNVP